MQNTPEGLEKKPKHTARNIIIATLGIGVFATAFIANFYCIKELLKAVYDLIYGCSPKSVDAVCINGGTLSLSVVAGIVSFFAIFVLVFNFAMAVYDKFCTNSNLINRKNSLYWEMGAFCYLWFLIVFLLCKFTPIYAGVKIAVIFTAAAFVAIVCRFGVKFILSRKSSV